MTQSISQNVLSNVLAACQVLWGIRRAKKRGHLKLMLRQPLKKRNLEMYRFTTAFLKTLGAIFELPQLYFPSVYFLQHNQDGYLPN